MEDALNRRQRPKVDRYPGHLFLTVYAAQLGSDVSDLRLAEISAFVTDRALVTVHDKGLHADDLTGRWDAAPDLLTGGAGGLLHGLLDLVVDSHFDAVQRLDDEVDDIEELLFGEPHQKHMQQRMFAMRKSLVQLRRVVLPMREVLNTLLRRDLNVVGADLTANYQDVYDHALRASEWTESLRDMVSTIFETNLSMQDHRLNNVMKKLAAWAAIISVPTAVTGYFGQNVPYPGFGKEWGFSVEPHHVRSHRHRPLHRLPHPRLDLNRPGWLERPSAPRSDAGSCCVRARDQTETACLGRLCDRCGLVVAEHRWIRCPAPGCEGCRVGRTVGMNHDEARTPLTTFSGPLRRQSPLRVCFSPRQEAPLPGRASRPVAEGARR